MVQYLSLFFLQGSEASLKFKESLHDTVDLSIKTNGNSSANSSGNTPTALTPRSSALISSQLVQRKQFAESQIGRNSFQKLLEPSSSQLPGMAPYRVVLGDVKEKVFFWFQTSATTMICLIITCQLQFIIYLLPEGFFFLSKRKQIKGIYFSQ